MKVKKVIIAAMLCAMTVGSVSALTACSGSEEAPAASSSEVIESTETVQEESSSEEASSEEVSSEESSSEESAQTGSTRDYTKEEAKYEDSNGIVIVTQDGKKRLLELFYESDTDDYVDALNSLSSKVGSDVRVFNMPAPLACEFYIPSNYPTIGSQKNCFDDIASKLDSSITSVDAISALQPHVEEEIYLRTDHHWQALGAYYAAQAFAEKAGVPFADLSEYTQKDVDGYVGELFTSVASDFPDTFTYYVPDVETSADYYGQDFTYSYTGDMLQDVDPAYSYIRFLGGDGSVVKVTTGADTDKSLLLIKDSYGNALVPFLTSSYKEIYVIDLRYFEKNVVNFIDELGIDDVLVSGCAYRVVDGGDDIANLISQDKKGKIKDEAPVSDLA